MSAIDPLANAKGVERLCELCQKPAYIQCSQCRVTYYCGREHQQVDFIGIHEKICQLLIPLRTALPFASSEEQRQHSKRQQIMRQMHILNLTLTAGQKLLFESKYTEAIPAAMQSLRVAVDLYGLASVELVPSYLILGRASIGLGNLQQAEEYLLQAQWTVLKTPECSSTIRHKLSRHLGLLYAAKSQFTHARRQLAYDIYYASEEFGVDDIRTSGGYFHLAEVFEREDNITVAQSLYHKVAEIWQKHLSSLVECRLNEANTNNSLIECDSSLTQPLDEAEQAEALHMLSAVLQFEHGHSSDETDVKEQSHSPDVSTVTDCSESIVKVYQTLAMLYYLLHDIDKAKEYGRKAVSASGAIHDEEFSRKLVEFLKICENINTNLE